MKFKRPAQKYAKLFPFRLCGTRALAFMAVALLLSAPLAAHAQRGDAGPNQAPPKIALPATQSTAPTSQTLPAGTPGTAANATAPAAANAGAPSPQAIPADTGNPLVAAPAPGEPAAGEPAVGGELLPQKLSLVGMYLDADRVVKAVMIGLALASLLTWTVFVAKTLELRKVRLEARHGLHILLDAVSLAQAFDQLREGDSAVAQLMQEAGQEIRLSGNARGDGLKERIALQLERLEMAISRKIARGTGVLATIGSTAVFVGLFGTVWGIMNSFIGISNAHTTNLAVVAPGIAQALLATAMGLIAAIPAVVIYNVLTRQTAHYRAMLGDASAQIMRLVSRDLDRAKMPLAQAAE
jgi:biopolymer transport protein ExbB